jgi:hypothetical protein
MQQLLMEREKNWSNLRQKLDETIIGKDALYNEYLDIIQQFNKYKEDNPVKTEPIDFKNIINQKNNEYDALKNEKLKLYSTYEGILKELEIVKAVSG